MAETYQEWKKRKYGIEPSPSSTNTSSSGSTKTTGNESYEEWKKRKAEEGTLYSDQQRAEARKFQTSWGLMQRNYNQYITQANDFFQNASKEYISGGKNDTAERLRSQGRDLLKWFDQYGSYLDADAYRNIVGDLQELDSDYGDLMDFYSQFETQDAYDMWDAYSTPEKRQARYEQNQTRLEELKKQRLEMTGLMSWGTVRQDTSDIDAEIAAIEREMQMYERGVTDADTGFYYGSKVVDDYSAYLNDPNYGQFSAEDFRNPTKDDLRYYDAMMDQSTWYQDNSGNTRNRMGDIVTEYVNADDPRYQIADPLGVYLQANPEDISNMHGDGSTQLGVLNQLLMDGYYGSWDQLDEREREIYYTLLGTQGKEAAMKYLSDMETELNRRNMAQESELYKLAFERANGWQRLGMSAVSIPANLLGGATAFVDDLSHTVRGENINPYSAAHQMQNYGQQVRANQAAAFDESSGWEIPGIGFSAGDLYQAAMSTADMFGGAMIGPTAYGALMGMGAASSEARRLYEMGASKDQIFWGSAAAGAAELVFEKFSIEKLIDIKDAETLGKLVLNALKQGGVEASEEGATELANLITNNLIMTSESDWAKLIEANNGDVGAATWAAIGQIGAAAAGGFVSGFMGGTGSATMNYAQNYRNDMQQGAAIREGNGVNPLRDLAMAMAEKETGKAQAALQKQSDRLGKDYRFGFTKDRDAGRLYRAVQNTVAESNKEDVANALQKQGYSQKEARKIADAFYTQAVGLEVSKAQQKVIQEFGKNEDVQKIIGDLLLSSESTISKRNQDLQNFRLDVIENQLVKKLEESTGEKIDLEEMDNAEEIDDSAPSLAVSEDGSTRIISTGKPVNITGFAKSKDGKAMLRTDTGELVAADDVSYANDSDALIYETIANLGAPVSNANGLLSAYKGKSADDAEIFARGIKEAFEYGQLGIPIAEMADSAFASKLSKFQMEYAYKQGKKAEGKKIARETSAIRKKGKRSGGEKRTGTVHFDRKGRTFSNVQETSLKTLDKLAAMLGMDFYVYESYEDASGNRVYLDENGNEVSAPNGFYDPSDGSIHIDLNAGNDGKGIILFTASHELVHFIRQWSPAKFKVMANFLVEQYHKEGVSVNDLIHQQMENAKQDGREITFEEAYEEMVADSMETMLADGNVVQMMAELKQRDRTLWQKICDWFRDLVADLQQMVDAYKGVKPETAEGRMVADMKDAITVFQALYTDALYDASESFQTAKNTTGEGGVKMQARAGGYDYSKSFAQQLKDYQNGLIPKGDTLLVGPTPDVLKGIGLNALPVTLNTTHVDYALNGTKDFDHYLGKALLSQLPGAINKPVAIMTSGTKNGSSVVMMLEIRHNGKQIVVPMVVDGFGYQNGLRIDSNSLTSIYGKNNSISKVLRDAIDQEGTGQFRLYYLDQNKATALLQGAKVPMPKMPATHNGGYIHSISDPGSPVKLKKVGQTDTIQFKKWFGSSKIVNADGSPKIMYHGSQSQFTVFDRQKAKSSGLYGKGFYFTDSDTHAGTYGNLYSVYLNVRNPLRSGAKRVSKKQVRAFLEAVADNEDYSIENYGTYDIDDILRNVMSGKSTEDAFRVIQDVDATAIGNMVEATELFNSVNGTDFDGIIVPTETVVFQPEQIKSATDNIGTFDGSNPDIRYSARNKSAKDVNAAIQKENAQLKEDVQELKELLKLQRTVTGGTKFTKSSVESMAGILMQNNNAKGDRKELARMLNDLYEYIATSKELSWEAVAEQAQPAVDWIRRNIVVKKELSQYAKDILHTLRTSRISLNETQKGEAAYRYGSVNDYRKSMMGSVVIANDGVPLDVQWQEWASTYPDIFNADISDSDMPGALADVVASLRNSDLSAAEYAYHADMIEQDILRQVYDSYWRVSTLRTVADVKQREINLLKGKHYQKMNELRQKHQEASEKMKQAQRDRIEKLRQEYRDSADKKIHAIKDKNEASRKRVVESREKTAMRHKIRRVVSELEKQLNADSKKQNIKEGLKELASTAIASAEILFADNYTNEDMVKNGVGVEVDARENRLLDETQQLIRMRDLLSDPAMVSTADIDSVIAGDISSYENQMKEVERVRRRISDNMRELRSVFERERNRLNKATVSSVLDNLAKAYWNLGTSEYDYARNAVDEGVHRHLINLSNDIGGTIIRDMSLAQLENVYEAFTMVMNTVRKADTSFADNLSASIGAMAGDVVREVKKVGGEKKYRLSVLDPVTKFLWDNLKPVYAMETIGSSTLTKVFENVRAGEDTWAVDVTDARKFFLEKSKKYGFNKWDFKKKYSFESASGISFELTLDQILSLYAYSKREQAHDHLRLGGFVFDSNIETTKEKDGKNSILKYKVNTADAHQITPDILADITGNLSAEQKQFVDAMQSYLSDVMGAKGNEVTKKMYGVKLFKEQNYFPLKSAKQFMFEQNEVAGEVRIKNSGFTNKVVAKANNPVILSNFMDVWSDHVDAMSMYHAFTLPLEDFNRVFNYNTPKAEGQESVSVKGTIQNAYGPAAVSYVKQLITDLNGGARSDSATGPINKLMGMYKKGAVFASLSVVVQQPSAIARAAALIDTKYFIGRKVDPQRHKMLWNEVKKYAPIAIIKEMGYFDTNVGKSTRDFIQGKEYDTVADKMKALVTDSDYRDEVLSKAPALADELAWCGIWEAVKRETKAKHPKMDVGTEEFLKLCGARFTEVITKTQVYDSVLSRSANMRSTDTGMKMATAFMAEPTTSINMIADALIKGKRGNVKYARTAIGAVIASQILNSILVAFVYAGRDDDEDESYWEKYVEHLTANMVDSLNPIGYIPFLRDVLSIAQGYYVERSDMAVISDLWKAWKNLQNDKVSPYMKFEGFVGSVAQLFGLPAKNILRDGRGVYNTIVSFVDGRYSTKAGFGYAFKSGLPKWMGGGAVSNQNQLYNAYLNEDAKHIARVEDRYKEESDAHNALRKGLRENDPRIREAAEYLNSDDYSSYLDIVEEIMDEGHFDRDDVIKAIRSESSALAPEEGTGVSNAQSLMTAEQFAIAVANGDNDVAKIAMDDIIATAQENGKTESEAVDSFRSSAKNALKDQYLVDTLSGTDAEKALVAYCGMDAEEAAAAVRKWEFASESGFAYGSMRQEFLDKHITAAQARDALITYGGETGDDADDIIEGWQFESQYGFAWENRAREYKDENITRNELRTALMKKGGMTSEEADFQIQVYDWEMEGYDGASFARVRDYNAYCSAQRVPVDVYLYIRKFASNTQNDIVNGKAVSGTAVKKIMAEINAQRGLTPAQKTAIAKSIGWKDSTIRKYKLW